MTDQSAAWDGDVAPFVARCLDLVDLRAFRGALATVPADQWPNVAEQLLAALAREDAEEPTTRQMQTGVPLGDRMRTPAGILRRQIRLEKKRIVESEQPSA